MAFFLFKRWIVILEFKASKRGQGEGRFRAVGCWPGVENSRLGVNICVCVTQGTSQGSRNAPKSALCMLSSFILTHDNTHSLVLVFSAKCVRHLW